MKAYLSVYLERFYWAPAFCLWRAFELDALSKMQLEHPLLDLGCGDGFFARTLFPKGVKAGIDIAVVGARNARITGAYQELAVADASQGIPYANLSFNTVLSNCAIEHIPHVDNVLREVRRVLRPGGQFIFTVPSEHFERYLLLGRCLRHLGLEKQARAYVEWRKRVLDIHNMWPIDAWCAYLTQAGLSVLEATYILPEPAVRLWDLLYLLFETGPLISSRRLTLGGIGYVLRVPALRKLIAGLLLEGLSMYCDRYAGPALEGGEVVFRAVRD